MNAKLNKLMAMTAFSALVAIPAVAGVVQTTGAGSAVSTVSAVAAFEDRAAATSTSYTENGLAFKAFNMGANPCGYAGCDYHFTSFSGNYMYGSGVNGYFTMAAAAGQMFTGLEFIADSGYGGTSFYYGWEALRNGVSIGSGSGSMNRGGILAFSSVTGFDTLRYTSSLDTNFAGYVAPAFDSVRAQYASAAAVPEPASLALMGLAVLGMAAVRRRK